MSFLTKIFGSRNERILRRLRKQVAKINKMEPAFEALSDDELRAKTDEFRSRLANGETLQQLLPEAFATVREAGKRVLGMRHFDVQLIGGMVLTNRCIAEMRTGEGKTLTATLPCYLMALEGKGVHVVTVNDYLARRDADTNRPLFEFLGMTVGVNIPGLPPEAKREAYAADITYATNSELGFDYLRDNLAHSKEERFQRHLGYALVDEVDSILIDEARTPLIISGQAEDSSELYIAVNKLIPNLIKQEKEDTEEYTGEGDYTLDLKTKQAYLTERGQEKVEEWLIAQGLMPEGDSLYSPARIVLLHHVMAALRANTLFERDVDYIVKDGEIVIVDEHTGRTMAGRRWSDGLHQAIEAKEGVEIKSENQTVASISYQNYFRLYDKLAGMTGTADTEAFEFQQIYGLETVVIPTNRPMIRDDRTDVMFENEEYKFNAIIEDIKDCVARNQPVLVGTVSVEKSELLSQKLKEAGIKHTVLNAKYHEQEAEIIAQAGKFGAVTIATNMAGRGTDIMLGGNSEFLAKQEMKANKVPENLIEESNTYYETDDQDILRVRETFKKLDEKYQEQIKEEKEKVIAAGGLKIIGTERHESRRIDNQLRGRSGRQGDPGESKFYIGLDDNLMKIFGGDRVTKVYSALNVDENMPIEVRMISKAVENAQKKVEGRNFSIRKNVLKYDDVMNVQREEIYSQRKQVLDGIDLSSVISNYIDWVARATVETYHESDEKGKLTLNIEALSNEIISTFGINMLDELKDKSGDVEAIISSLQEKAHEKYAEKEKEIEAEQLREIERIVMLKVVDQKWMDHIDNMDELRKGIGLQGWGQKDPVVQYRIVGTEMFDEMIEAIKVDVVKLLMNLRQQKDLRRSETAKITKAALQSINSVDGGQSSIENPEVNRTVVREEPKVGRNDLCPCGSGKKYKNCCGRNK